MLEHGTLLLQILCCLLLSRQRAEQLAAEVFVQAYRQGTCRLDAQAAKRHLLQLALALTRREADSPTEPARDANFTPGPGILAKVLALPKHLQVVLLLRCYAGLQVEEVAAVLGCPANVVSDQLRLAVLAISADQTAAGSARPRHSVSGHQRQHQGGPDPDDAQRREDPT